MQNLAREIDPLVDKCKDDFLASVTFGKKGYVSISLADSTTRHYAFRVTRDDLYQYESIEKEVE